MVPGHPWRVMATARWRAIVVMAMDVFAAGVLAVHGGARAG
jgi:hypothetical protein